MAVVVTVRIRVRGTASGRQMRSHGAIDSIGGRLRCTNMGLTSPAGGCGATRCPFLSDHDHDHLTAHSLAPNFVIRQGAPNANIRKPATYFFGLVRAKKSKSRRGA